MKEIFIQKQKYVTSMLNTEYNEKTELSIKKKKQPSALKRMANLLPFSLYCVSSKYMHLCIS